MNNNGRRGLARIIKQQRASIPLTLYELSAKSGVSPSHLGRIERGERFPSARILRKIARPLGLSEDELFMLAGFLSEKSAETPESGYRNRGVDPYVASVLAQEPVAVQRAVIGILNILRSLVKSTQKE